MSDGLDITQHIPPDPLMAQAWMDCLHWAVGVPDIVARFRADTGNNWNPGTTPETMMIDKATGADRAFIEAFIQWFSANVWGNV